MNAYDKRVIATILVKRHGIQTNGNHNIFQDNIYGKLFWDEIEWNAALFEGMCYLVRKFWWVILPLVAYRLFA